MKEGLALKVVVDECRNGADTPESHPDEDETRRICENNRDNLFRLDGKSFPKILTVSQDDLIAFLVSPGTTIVDKKRPVGRVWIQRNGLEDVERIDSISTFSQPRFDSKLNQVADQIPVVENGPSGI